MEFYYYSPSETFVMLTADQFVGRDDGLLEQQAGYSFSTTVSLETYPLFTECSVCCISFLWRHFDEKLVLS